MFRVVIKDSQGGLSASMQKRQGFKIASGLVMGSSMMLMSLLPAASAMASTAPAVTSVTLSSEQGTVAIGNTVSFTATATQTGSGTPMYQFWYQGVNGNWHGSAWSSSDSFSLPALQKGSYEVVAYAMDKGQTTPISSESTNSNQFVNVDSAVGLSASSTDVAPGTAVTVTASATNLTSPVYQFWVYHPNQKTWVASGNYQTSPKFTFTAENAGNYQVVVYAKDLNAPQDAQFSLTSAVVAGAFGEASQVAFSSTKTLVADGQETTMVTAKVEDANGNLVGNFNGTATVTDSNAAAATTTIANTAETQSSALSGTTLTFTNGEAQYLVEAGTAPGLSTTLSGSGLTGTSGSTVASTVTYGSATITTVPQTATSISVSATSSVIAVNTNNSPDTVNVVVEDQVGEPMLGGTYILSADVMGGGTFTGGATTETLVASPSNASATVYGVMGVQGTYLVTVTGSGLTEGQTSIKAAVAGNAADLTASAASSSFVQGSMTGDVVTLGATDSSGVPVALSSTVSPEVTFTNSAGTATNFTLLVGTTAITANASGVYDLPAGTTTYTVEDISKTADAGTYKMTVADGEATSPLASTSLSLTETAASASKIGLTAGTDVLMPTALGTTMSVQVEDQYGNPVAVSGVTINVSASGSTGAAELNGGSYGASPTATVQTNASGVATFSFAAQDYTSTWMVTATVASGALYSGSATSSSTATEYVENHPVASYSFTLTDTSSGTYLSNTVYAQAGNTVAITSALVDDALDANGNAVSASVAGNDNVTVTVYHASGLSGYGSTGVTATNNASANTETITGSLSSVSTALSSLTAAQAGETTVSIKDNSTGATGAASIDVVAGTTATQLTLSGLSNGETLTTGTVYPVTVELADAGGNPVVAASTVTVDLGAVTGITYENASHVPVTTVTIGQGQTSATIYVVTSGTAFTSDTVTASSTSPTVSGSVTGLND